MNNFMHWTIRWLLTVGTFCMSWGSLEAQTLLQGKVLDQLDGEPLIGATVVLKGISGGTVTDVKGQFSIQSANKNPILVVSYVGYLSQEYTYSGQREVVIALKEDLKELEQVVVVGYGTSTKKELTGAVASVKADEIMKTNTSDVNSALQGVVAGVNVQASSGRPGSIANIQIRGLGSLSSSALTPLYIVDGIPYEGVPNLAPEQISTLDILKDGAAASIYGTRASNGVILITTKRGEAGTMKVNFSSYYGIQNITSGTPLNNTKEQLYVENVKLAAIGRTPLTFYFNPDALDYDTDFVGALTNDRAPMQSHNLLVSGGQKDLTFSVNTNYFNQEGILIKSGFDRFNTQMNGQFTKGKFKAFASVAMAKENTKQEPWGLYEYAIFQMPWQKSPYALPSIGDNAVLFQGGNAEGYSYLARLLKDQDKREVKSSNITMNLQYEILPGLTYKMNAGRNTWDFNRTFFQPQYLLSDQNGLNAAASRPKAILTQSYTFTERITWENLLNYSKKWGDHTFNLLAGYTMERFQSKNIGATANDFLSNDTPVFNAASTPTSITGYNEEGRLTGMIGRLQYNYKGKYLFSASLRRDGSSNFGPSNRFGYFPGLSVGWNVSDEDFFKNNDRLSFISNLKFRASYGQVGNQNIPRYQYAALIEPGHDYPFGTEGSEYLDLGAIQKRYANENIKWETNISKNVGVDLLMFDGRVSVTADLYHNAKEDMLLALNLAPSTGTWQPRDWSNMYKSRLVNIGNMVNKGVELAASYNNRTQGGLHWKLSGTFTKNVNKITDLGPLTSFAFGGGRPVISRGERTDFTTYLAKGYPAGSFFLIPTSGVLKSQEELDAYKKLDGNARLGDLRYVDTNEDGKISDLDRVYHGSGQSDFETGLGINLDYKSFDFFSQLYYSQGAEIYNGSKLFAYGMGRHRDQYYQWSTQNPTSDIPAVRESSEHNNTRARSDYFLEDGTYLRIRSLTLGYTLPKSVLGKIAQRARFYITAQNPFTFTKYQGYNPEIGGDGIFTRGVDLGNYPVSRKFLVGFQLDFN
ncbi:TonB-linked SusC/RagA family outer membrane protein [Dyadobacter jejuensis]|uniref:TonB-linked SusC/RagA family outer membrane protein n=2 Tax=Dyadobacter jejuensis TaxID=1082580 RepID=A0A316ARV9_9BACT|nr:TonB-linked SusC/RagA family outer membrane protein [Dyadobacter jejuensis]